jgi:vitamin B12 transporter
MSIRILLKTILVSLLAAGAAATAGEPVKTPTPPPVAESDDAKKTEKIVVTATRVETPEREVGSSITAVRSDEIIRRQRKTVASALRGTPGLDVARSGGPGAGTSLFLRGAPSEFTHVMIDGVEMVDPMSAGRSLDFAHLTTDNVERVEVLRGPQSTLWGSDAMGGVVNIITRRGSGEPRFYALTEGGSFHTYRQAMGLSGGSKLYHYSVGASLLKTDGISRSREEPLFGPNEEDGNPETDGYSNASFSGRFGITPIEQLELQFFVRYIDAETHIDGWDYAGGTSIDDLDHSTRYEQLLLKGQATVTLFDGIWDQTISVTNNDVDRDETNDQDDSSDNILKAAYNGRILKFDWQHNLHLHETNTLTLGMEIENERGDSQRIETMWGTTYNTTFDEEDEQTWSLYAQDQIKLFDSLFITLGIRHDEHQRFGTETTWRVAAAYLYEPTDTRIKASAGTGFKAPSLFQLHSSFGNLDLDPQEARGWDFGFEQYILERKYGFGATWFRNDFDDMITYDFVTSKYMNINEVDTEGLEFFATAEPLQDLHLRVYYTYMQAEDRDTGLDLPRRAKNKYSADVSYLFLEKKASVSLGVDFVGDRPDISDMHLDSYTVVNLAGSYQVHEHVQLYGRIDNLFDEDYQEAATYGVPGIGAYFGVKVTF